MYSDFIIERFISGNSSYLNIPIGSILTIALCPRYSVLGSFQTSLERTGHINQFRNWRLSL